MDEAAQPSRSGMQTKKKKNGSAPSSLRENTLYTCRQINGVHFHPVKLLIPSWMRVRAGCRRVSGRPCTATHALPLYFHCGLTVKFTRVG